MKKLILLLPFCIFLSACKNEAPNCSDKKTVKLIKQIVRDEFKKAGIDDAINIKMQVTNIQTSEHILVQLILISSLMILISLYLSPISVNYWITKKNFT